MKQIDSELNDVTMHLINKYNLIFISRIVYIRCFVRFVNPTVLDSLSDVLIYETVQISSESLISFLATYNNKMHLIMSRAIKVRSVKCHILIIIF